VKSHISNEFQVPPPLLSVRGVSKQFGAHEALTNVTFDIAHGEFVALLGPSGCGKTTLLRCIAGFSRPNSGSIFIAGEDVTQRPPYRRPLNTVFQNYALFPHMRVKDNVAYGPRRQGLPKVEAQNRAREALKLVGLDDFGDRHPEQLSGGQQQRVALARALVNRPMLLLLDEPLSALDLKLRKRMQIELKHLHEKLGIAFMFVTHDQEEAMTMADRIIVMNAGRIEQSGPGEVIYRLPATRFVAEFIGEANLIECAFGGPGQLRPLIGSTSIPYAGAEEGKRYVGVLRPEHIRIGDARQPGCLAAAGVVEDVINAGAHTTITVLAGGQLLSCRQLGMGGRELLRGACVTLGFQPQHMHIIAE
jgi:spermidine/putrescine transport system ATP-binding protein